MPIGVTKTTVTPGVEIFQKILEVAPGGFTLDNSVLTAGADVKAGTILGYNETTRKANVVKQAVLQANASDSATAYRVLKGHHFQVGEPIAAAVSGAAYDIESIVTTESAYDTINIGTTLGVALTAGDVIFEAAAETADAAALKVTPKGVLKNDVIVADNEPVTVVTRGSVFLKRITGGVHSAVKTALSLIIFSEFY